MGARLVTFVTLAAFTWSGVVGAQAPAPAPPPPPAADTGQPVPGQPAAAGQPAAQGEKTFSQQELDQLVAPVALYPDSLLAQVLMASTYPLDVVSAERWVKANPGLKDKALEDALQQQPWDPSVKSITAFPQVLTMMSEKLDWTQKLGDAFLAQQADVMATAQALRAKAAEQGALKDTKEQKVITEKTETNTTIIKIEPTNPEVVYVPTYNPTVVYGAWPYPAYPPYYYYPPGYVAGGALLGFTAGVIVGGALWGGCNWGRNEVNVNVNRYNNFNKTNISNGNWQHNADRRGAVPYKDKAVSQKYNRGTSPGAQARDSYRGRDAGATQARTADAARSRTGTGPSAGAMDRGGGQGGNRDMSGARNASAFDTGSRAQTRDASSRGASSMSSSARSSSMSSGARSSGGGARAGGGGARGGGGRGGGGRR